MKPKPRCLRETGHDLVVYKRRNDEISDYPVHKKLSLLWKTSWAGDSAKELRKLFREDRAGRRPFPEHFPLIFTECVPCLPEFGIPVVQSLRNYRLICPKATFYRDGTVCEDWHGNGIAPARRIQGLLPQQQTTVRRGGADDRPPTAGSGRGSGRSTCTSLLASLRRKNTYGGACRPTGSS